VAVVFRQIGAIIDLVTPLIMKGGMPMHEIFKKLSNRGGRSNARGGSYERGRSNRRSYGRMESRDDFMDRFEELMDEAPDEVTRKKFEKLMMEMR
jgi:hypothetical protein